MSQAVNSIGEPLDPEQVICVQRSGKHVVAEYGSEVIADSHNTLALIEADYPEIYYFPAADVRMEFLQPTATSSHCPYKGDASWWSIRAGQKELIDAAWSYRRPLKECPEIKDHIAFYAEKMDRFVVEQDPVQEMIERVQIARNWLPRYTGMPLDEFGDYILLTNFQYYLAKFVEKFDCDIYGENKPMPSATNDAGLSIVNFGIGSANAATIMDLLSARAPKGVLFIGKCGGLKKSSEIGRFILPIAAIRGEGTSNDYLPPEVPALPSFKLHKFVSDKIIEHGYDYRTGVIYTTNRRVWEHDEHFLSRLKEMACMGIDMETATLFIAGHYNEIARGALLLVSDVPITPDGVQTEEMDVQVTEQWSEIHLQIGIEAMMEIGEQGEKIKHFKY